MFLIIQRDLTIGKDGHVTATDAQTGDTVELGQITIADFINPAGLIPLGESLLCKSPASGDVLGNPTTGSIWKSLQQGMIELSNVKLVKWNGWFNYSSKSIWS